MSRINKFVLTVSLLIFIMISAVACGIYTQMVKERVYSLKQSVIDTAFAVANIAEYRRSVAIDLINTLNPTEEQLLVGLRTAYADSVSPSYLYDVGPYLISSDECIQVKEFEKNYCADIMQVVKYRHVKNTGFISFDGKTFAYLPTGLYVFAYKKDVYLRVCTLIIFFAALVAVISGTSCLYLVRRVINRGIVEKEAIINNHFERVLDGGLFFSAADVKKLYSMYNSAFLDDLTKAMGRKSFDEDLKALPEKGGYLCLFDVDKFKNINDTFGHLLGDEVLMKVVKILKSQIPVDKGKIYRFGGDEFAVIYTGGTLEELLSILKEIVHFQVGSINLSTSIGVAHSNECTTVERLKMLADERLYKSKKNGRAQISWQ
ncbi:diguanylate cyclase [Escherichia coli]|nr:diguanylate cyclase [Escherichia coli]